MFLAGGEVGEEGGGGEVGGAAAKFTFTATQPLVVGTSRTAPDTTS